jgi:hypothetical protein
MIYAAHYAMLSSREMHDEQAFQTWRERGLALAKRLAKARVADEWHRTFLPSLFNTDTGGNP